MANKDSKKKAITTEKKQIRGAIPYELYQQIMVAGGILGFSKADILQSALLDWLRSNAPITGEAIARKAQSLGITEQEVISEIYEQYEQVSRNRRARLQSNNDEEE